MTPDRAMDYTITAVVKAVAVLEAFQQPPHTLSLADVVRITGLNKNQVFRLLATLEQTGLLVREAGGTVYRLSWRVAELGQAAASGISLRKVAQPIAAKLAAQTAETVLVVAFDGAEAVGVDRWESPQPIKLSAEVGQRFPLHAGACPKAILAHLPPAQGREIVESYGFIAYTAKTARSWAELEPELDQIRRQGYALSREDVVEEADAVGTAIFDGAGRVVGAISIAGPLYRFAPGLEKYAAMVKKAAAEISAQLGHIQRT